MSRGDAFDDANNRLAARINDIDPTFWDRLTQSDCDIDPDFLGFVFIYEQLASIIPTGRTVIDLGCSYAPQAAYFMDHRRYIGINLSDCPKLQTPNAAYFTMPIRKWIEEHAPTYRDGPTFAICSYVPPWCDDNRKLVREAFDSVFTFYPERGDDPEIDAVFLKMRNSSQKTRT